MVLFTGQAGVQTKPVNLLRVLNNGYITTSIKYNIKLKLWIILHIQCLIQKQVSDVYRKVMLSKHGHETWTIQSARCVYLRMKCLIFPITC